MAAQVSLLLVMGLPGAGKSTLCLCLGERLDSFDILHVDFDKAAGDGEMKEARAVVERQVRGAVSERQSCPGRDLLLLLDDNFYYDSMRRPFWAIAKDFGCGFGCVEVTTPLSRCLDNDAGRTTPVGEATIVRIAERMEWAHCHHEADVCLNVSDVSEPDWDAIRRFVQFRHSKPLSREKEEEEAKRREMARRESERNAMHQADLFLRTLIREAMTDGAASKSRSRELSEVKKSLLASLRADPSLLPDVADCAGRQELETMLRRQFTARLK